MEELIMTPLVEKYRPKTLDTFAGLTGPRAILSALAREPYESAWLLLGPSGLGKTCMALALAEQIGGQVHHIPSRKCDLETVDQVIHSCWYVPMNGGWHVLVVDEADQMTRAAQLAFLSKLDTTAAPPKTIFIFTANETSLLEKRFLSRCRIVNFSNDAALLEPVAALLAKIWAAEAPGRAQPDFRAMIQEADFNVRSAIMTLEMEVLASGSFASASRANPVSRATAGAIKPRVKCSPHTDARLPAAGTELVREFKNKKVTVRVLADGFEFEGRPYGSLSKIAREVTQSNWNGFSFFRLNGATP